MSIIAQQTPITLSNETKYYLDIKIIAEQDEEFRMTAGNNNNVIPISNAPHHSSQGLFGTMMNGILDIFTGSKLHEIRINLPSNSSVPISVRCTSSLSFNTNVVSKHCTDQISGDFELGPEYHGEPITIEWKALLGFGYDAKGDVAIGGTCPSKRDLAANTVFYNKSGKVISGPEVTPACCRIKFN